MGKTYSWQGGTSTAFGVAANWFDVTDGVTAASPPGAGDLVELTGSGTIDGAATGLASLTVSNTSGPGYAIGATLGVSHVEVDGQLALSGGATLNADTVTIDGGTLLQDGGVLNASSVSGTAVQVNDGGMLTISGGVLNTAGTFLIGDFPDNGDTAGTFTASAGAWVTSYSAAGDAVLVSAEAGLTGAHWAVDGNMTLEPGTVSLQDDAVLDVSGTLTVGSAGIIVGETDVSKIGSTVGPLNFEEVFGALSVASGSTLVVGNAEGGQVLFLSGSDSIDGGHALVEGQASIREGVLTVSDGGTLSVTDRGAESAGAALSVEVGLLDVTGPQTALRLGGGLLETEGNTVTEKGAQVTLTSASADAPGVAIDGATGFALTVDGAGSVLNGTGQMLVGAADAGTLTISNGAAVHVAASSGQTVPDAVVQSGRGLTSMVSVLNGSDWSVAGALEIAPHGAGALAVSGGGTVSAGSVVVGGAGANLGSLSLAGSSDVLTTQLLTVGTTGTVTLGTGSHLSAGGLLVGTAGQGVATAGAATIDVAGGKLSVFGGASVHGAVVLSQGGTLSVSNGLTLAAGSTIIGQGVLGAGNIVDLGRIGTNGGTMTCLGPVNGTGLLSVANGDIVLTQGEASTVGLVFGANGTFTAAGVGLISGTITGWTTGDALDFTGRHVASDSLSGHVLTLFDGSGTVLGRETFAGSVTSSSFSLSADHGAGTLLSFHG